jgi:ABC-type lipoprotein export system ATPase subunit
MEYDKEKERSMEIRKLTILGGRGKDGAAEKVREVSIEMGQVVSIVGPTGCGKTTLINDIELFACENTPSRRRILINGEAIPEDATLDPSRNPMAMISQHTNFLSDLPVREFLGTHARIRGSARPEALVGETQEFANQLTGEPLILDSAMTELSGGQTRALLIADAVVIGQSPIILLDEIENAGIHRTRALELLRRYEKMFLFVTHDPRIALLSDFRIVIRGGAMQEVIETNDEEQRVAEEIRKLDDLLLEFRQRIRQGERLGYGMLEERLRALGYLG